MNKIKSSSNVKIRDGFDLALQNILKPTWIMELHQITRDDILNHYERSTI
jgi:hypothetical protein